MTPEITQTQRGFRIANFKDGNNVQCSLQESSAIRDEGLIWFGCDDLGLQQFIPYGNPSWRPVDLKSLCPQAEYFSSNTRMHLTQQHVKDLLPALKYFAKHGHLPPEKKEQQG